MIDFDNKSNSDKILYLLKTTGPDTAASLAKKLNITSMGARQHLQNLTADGLISFQDINQGRGRPARYWSITSAANSLFPNNHSELTVQLINAAEEAFGEEGVSKLIDVRQKKAVTRYHETIKGCHGLEGKLLQLAKIRSEEGYMANIEKTEYGFRFNENHCPISSAAMQCDGFCESELAFIREVLGNQFQVKREEHILSDDRRCSYHISDQRQLFEAHK
jgi:predicted ArsR family transcriptional regulator